MISKNESSIKDKIWKLRLGKAKIWKKGRDLVFLSINSKSSKLALVVNTFSVFSWSPILEAKADNRLQKLNSRKKKFSDKTQ